MGAELLIRVWVSKRIYILKKYWKANNLDDIRLEEYEMHIYDKTEKVFLKWREGADGAEELKKERQEDVKTEYCRVCRTL